MLNIITPEEQDDEVVEVSVEETPTVDDLSKENIDE